MASPQIVISYNEYYERCRFMPPKQGFLSPKHNVFFDFMDISIVNSKIICDKIESITAMTVSARLTKKTFQVQCPIIPSGKINNCDWLRAD